MNAWLRSAGHVRLGDLLAYMPGAGALAAWLFWLAADGGYFPRDYLPVGLAAAALVGVFAVFGGAGLPRRGPARIALLLLAAGVALSFVSILWADWRGYAFDSSVKLATLLVVTWLVAITPWTPRSAAVMLGAWVLGAAAIGAVALATTAAADSSADIVLYGRFAEPIGYTNGVAALAVMAFLPALTLASRAEAPPFLQGPLLACACFLLELALLPQSRAALLSLAVGVPLLLILAPGRIWLLLRVALVAAVAALALGPVLDVYEAAQGGGDPMEALRHAWDAMALTSLLAGALGVGAGLLQRRSDLEQRLPRLDRRVGFGIGIAMVVALVVVGAALAAGRGGVHLDGGNGEAVGESSSRISSLDPEERLDYWRVALDMFATEPVLGSGAGGFELTYAREREEAKPSRYPHNVFLRALGETGAVGLLLFLAMLAAITVALYRSWRISSPLGAAIAAACFALGASFLIHDSLDWMDEIPALAGPALGLALMAGGLGSATRPSSPPRPSRPVTAAVALGSVLVFVALGTSWLATRYLERASRERAADPAAAFADYERAARLLPWSARPLLEEGVAAIDAAQPGRARAAFVEALEREDGAFAHLELALLAAEAGRSARAKAEIATALALEPRSIPIRSALRQIESGRTLEAARVNGRLFDLEKGHSGN